MQKQTAANPVPLVLRSRQELIAKGASFLQPSALTPTTLPIKADGATYSMAQEIAWLDAEHFAVGRWDGSISVFAYNPSTWSGPLISTAVSSPSTEGVQMIQWLAHRVFASSNDAESIVVWRAPKSSWKDLQKQSVLHYDATLGVANSAESFTVESKLYLVVGHENGYVSIWGGKPNAIDMMLLTTVDVRSPNPVNPWGIHNVRGVSLLRVEAQHGYVITGSEDGNLCVIRVPDGAILSTTVFNPAAQRGINSIAAVGHDLLVANCSVGPDDKNLWYYRVNSNTWTVTLKDSANLKVNPSAPQVFNFCTIWGKYNEGRCFFASTEEGALWMGTVVNHESLSIIGYEEVTTLLGSALAYNVAGRLALVSYNLYEYITVDDGPPLSSNNPERIEADA